MAQAAPAEHRPTPLWHKPPAGISAALQGVKKEISLDNVSLVAAGVAFYLLLAVFPGLIAFLLIVGLVLDPGEVQQRLGTLTQQLPDEAATIVTEQTRRIAATAGRALTLGLIASIAGALWGASSGMAGLMKGLSIAYDARPRTFVRQRAVALVLTLGAFAFLGVVLGAIIVVPVVLTWLPLGGATSALIQWGRWPILVLSFLVAAGLLYRFAPNREGPRLSFITPGSLLATVLWLVGSALFALYVESFGRFQQTYGAIAGVIVLLLWLYLTAFVILLGAELNAEIERQSKAATASA